MNDGDKAFGEGNLARANNESRSSCPYPEDSVERAHWMVGYDWGKGRTKMANLRTADA